MKIAIWHNLPSGGGKRALYDHVRGLRERGHTLESWCPSSADQSFLPLGTLIPEHVLPFSWYNGQAQHAWQRFSAPYATVAKNIAAMDQHCQQCAQEIERGGFDLLFANACMFFRVTAIGRYVRLPKVLYLQEPYRWLYEARPQLPWAALPPAGRNWWRSAQLRQRLRDQLRISGLRIQVREEARNARGFDAVLVNSLYSRESILRAYGLDARVCYLGLAPERFADLHLPREDFVVGVGAIVSEKNIRLCIEAIGAIATPRPQLIWIGNVAVPAHLAELQQHAAQHGVDFQVRVNISDRELVETLNRALAMIYTPRLEPFGYAPLEANACGTPVIAVAEGGVRETVLDGLNGLLAESNPRALARAIARLRGDPLLARRLGEQGRAQVLKHWSLHAAIDRLEQRFAEVCDEQH